MTNENDALRALRAPIDDRLDLRHRIMDALVDRGGNLKAIDILGKTVNRIDDLVWVDGDMRQTRLRYDIFNTCLRKHINLGDKTPGEGKGATDDRERDLLDACAALINARGDGRGDDFGGHPDFTAPQTVTIDMAAVLNRQADAIDLLTVILGRLADMPMIAGLPLTASEIAAKDKKAPVPGTPGAKDKTKS